MEAGVKAQALHSVVLSHAAQQSAVVPAFVALLWSVA